MESRRSKRGQFVIIAVMLTAIMIVSIGALMHNAITYYKHEPWEEYSTLIGDIELNSRRLVGLSLAGYTNPPKDGSILEYNLVKWQNDLKAIYPTKGIILNSSSYSLSDTPDSSNPTATASFILNISSIGLKGYTFSVIASLHLTIKPASAPYNFTATVTKETSEPVSGLGTGNFRINGTTPTTVSPVYEDNTLVYKITVHSASLTLIEVLDQRGIRAQV